MLIEDGKGTGYKARVDSGNRLHISSVSETASVHAVREGDAYNLNTGNISFSAAGTLLYLKNNEDRDLFIESIAFGAGSASTSDIGELTIKSNISGGDLISDATAIPINQNRNIGSSKTLTATAYIGKSSGTSTGGSDVLFVYTSSASRALVTVNLIIKKGSNIAIIYDPKLSSGSVKAYVAAICYLVSPDSAD